MPYPPGTPERRYRVSQETDRHADSGNKFSSVNHCYFPVGAKNQKWVPIMTTQNRHSSSDVAARHMFALSVNRPYIAAFLTTTVVRSTYWPSFAAEVIPRDPLCRRRQNVKEPCRSTGNVASRWRLFFTPLRFGRSARCRCRQRHHIARVATNRWRCTWQPRRHWRESSRCWTACPRTAR